MGERLRAQRQKAAQGVEDTAGLVALYDGEPILAMFHANSGGMTEDVEAVYSETCPICAACKATIPSARRPIAQRKRAAKIINKAYPKAKVTAKELPSSFTCALALPRAEWTPARWAKSP
jgi:SpoIID/LytB domain protein